MQTLLDYRLDFVVFAVAALAAALVLQSRVARRPSGTRELGWIWIAVFALVLLGFVTSEWAGRSERHRLREMVAGLAPTYAMEMTKAGHEAIRIDTPPDDPNYVSLIERQKQWLKVNPTVNDIYTFRRLDNGQVVLLVDSETDYNHDGQFDDATEARTAIGEPYDEATEVLAEAFRGVPLFDSEPYSDPWGTWVSAYYPMFRADGSVDAVLGVDYAAADWLMQISLSRAAMLSFVTILTWIVLGTNAAIQWQKREIAERAQNETLLQAKSDQMSRYAAALEANNGELRQVRTELEQAALAKSQFLANMSHEIRTPLNGVIGMLELLNETSMDATQRRFVRTARISADCLLSLINDILDFSKIEAGKLELDEADFNLLTLMEDLGDMFAERAEKKGIELCLDIDAAVPKLARGDADRLRQVLINFVTNAIKFTERGQIVIRTHRVSPMGDEPADQLTLWFAVQDTGIGIPADRMHRLFKSFSQVDASTTRKYGGTGLGLALSKQLIELFGGEVHVESVVGQGSTFSFTAKLKHVQKEASDLIAPSSLHNLRVLVVDDNPTNRTILKANIETWGFTCELAKDARSGLDKLEHAARGKGFDLAVVDMQMPGMDGLQMIEKVRANSRLNDLKVLMLTSLSNTLSRQELRDLGMSSYLTKPVRQSRLLEAIVRSLTEKGDGWLLEADEAENAKVSVKPASGARVLLAEDNEVNQFVALEILSRAGMDAHAVGNGREACDAIRTGDYDIILMDCQMPVMDGLEAARSIRREEAEGAQRKRIPIIALTANAVKGDREVCLAAGMDDYVTKPINPKQLIEAIQRLIPNVQRALPPAPAPAAPTPAPTPTPAPSLAESPATADRVESPGDGRLPMDQRQLLKNCMDDPDIAQQVLEMFAPSIDRQIELLQTAIQQANLSDATRAAHTVKGLAGNVAATKLQQVAANCERCGRAGDLEQIAQQFDELRTEVAACVQSIPTTIQGLSTINAL